LEKYGYRFSFGPWNIHGGADPFGPPVSPAPGFESKLTLRLIEVVRSQDQQAINTLIAQRNYEERDWLILNSLMGL
jgi:hypothetical protein